MDIQLSNIRLPQSEKSDIDWWRADLVINNKKVAEIGDNGMTGEYLEPINPEAKALIADAEKYCNGLPRKTLSNGSIAEQDYTLDDLIGEILQKFVNQKGMVQLKKGEQAFSKKQLEQRPPGESKKFNTP